MEYAWYNIQYTSMHGTVYKGQMRRMLDPGVRSPDKLDSLQVAQLLLANPSSSLSQSPAEARTYIGVFIPNMLAHLLVVEWLPQAHFVI